MSNSEGYQQALLYIIRTIFENIDSPFVKMPLGIALILILTYPITNFQLFLYAGLVFLIIAFIADWGGRWENRKPIVEKPQPTRTITRSELLNYQRSNQSKAIQLLRSGKRGSALKLTDDVTQEIEKAIEHDPDDSQLHSMKGFSLKDVAQFSRNVLPSKERKKFLNRAEESFLASLELDPNDPGAHNGMGNVHLFRGNFEKALEEINKAIELTGGNYPAAENDKGIAMKALSGEIPAERIVI